VALEVNLLQKVAQLVGDIVRRIAAERGADQLLGLGQQLGVKRERRGAAEQDGARRLGIEAGGEGGGGLGLQLTRLAEMAQRQHLVALSACGKREVGVFHRLPMGCLDAAHTVSTHAIGVPNSTTAT
jgi:hypothetical protein